MASNMWTTFSHQTSLPDEPNDDSSKNGIIIAVVVVMVIILAAVGVLVWLKLKYKMGIFSLCYIPYQKCRDIITGDRGDPDVESPSTGNMGHPPNNRKIAPLPDENKNIRKTASQKLQFNENIYQPITLERFLKQFAGDVETESLKREYEIILEWSAELNHEKQHGQLEKNKSKNRYSDIIPYDYNRVPLLRESYVNGFDYYWNMSPTARSNVPYINASYIHGFGTDQTKYIAAQGPVKTSIDDFWEMVWQEESEIVVMLTSLYEQGKKKCEKYWPDKTEERLVSGDKIIKLNFTQGYAYYDYRSITIKKQHVTRIIQHYQYRQWPDKEAPEMVLAILDLHRKVFSQARHTKGPIIVHCSAGVGRTGTFISIDYIQEQAKKKREVDIMGCVHELRLQRVSMVQRVSQYIFLHEAIHEILTVGNTVVPTAQFGERFRKDENKDFPILKHFKHMCAKKSARLFDDALCGLQPENKDKNRDLQIVPADEHMPYLSTPMIGRNQYINAVYVDTFLKKDGIIVTQLPFESTFGDFWRLVYDQRCTTIILLDEVNEFWTKYWPEDDTEKVFGNSIAVSGRTNKKESTQQITVREFQVALKRGNDNINNIVHVKMFQLTTWPQKDNLPLSKRDLLNLIIKHKKNSSDTTIVQCLNGCKKSGIFCTCLYIVDQMKMDNSIDVYHASRITTANRPQFIQTKEQFKFLHEFTLDYLSHFDDYVNFVENGL